MPRATLASANETGGPSGAQRGSNSSCVAVQGRRHRGPAAACVAELGDGSLQRSSRRLDPTVQLVELLRRCYGGQGGLNRAGGEESRRRRELTVERSRCNSGEAGAGLRGKELGDLPGATAKLLRGLARAKGQRSGVLTAAQRSGTGWGKTAQCARVLGGVKMAGAGVGVCGCQNKGRAGILDVRARWGRLRQSRP